ncbi:hypothetical protein BN8_04716 [Fibrisoma limi BUZ 3]|uniref:DUF1573 domain-containing protein n=1 Tax=Fibrisoma limi BUZ 3 TaxID=1185876 RepID=I2GNH9_9BACT|nr:DUF1573 domain-containing protein [Fibrisoma limi]CCH55457.1 hypothetical protein BN8_04716 [Fibrisoma limi BUZ 3]
MKRILFFGSLLLMCAVAASTSAHRAAALFGWGQTSHNFGRIPQGKPVTATFEFTNKGEIPLVISNARGSCGCTGVEYPKAAVMPGQAGTIKATFNAASPGAFNKTVTVESNAEGGVATLYIKGEVMR